MLKDNSISLFVAKTTLSTSKFISTANGLVVAVTVTVFNNVVVELITKFTLTGVDETVMLPITLHLKSTVMVGVPVYLNLLPVITVKY
jgi:hypothetical protein